MKKVIVALLIILILLVAFTLFINKLITRPKVESQSQFTIAPTIEYQSRTTPDNTSPKALPVSDLVKLQQLKTIIPLTSSDFEVGYLETLDKFIIVKKTPQAEEKFVQWAKIRGADTIVKDNPDLFVFTDKPLSEYQKEIEENYRPIPSITMPTPSLKESETTQSLIDILKVLLNFTQDSSSNPVPVSNPPDNGIKPTVGPTPQYSSPPTSLTQLFNEAGTKVGVPAKILEAIMRIECGSTFNLSPEEISAYAQAGGRIPFCGVNHCSAAGPMQITTGVDNLGDRTCSRCSRLGFCPNMWSIYGNAVQKYSYSHQTNPMNIRDAVYAAAEKLKTDSKAASSTNWTEEQVKYASYRYHGHCDEAHRYSFLGNRTYCEYVWWYYQNQ
jgi:hypothetical protein